MGKSRGVRKCLRKEQRDGGMKKERGEERCPCSNPVREEEIRLAVWCRHSEEIFFTGL